MSADDTKATNEQDSGKTQSYSPKGEAQEKEFGGTLSGAPLPNEPFYPLRQDQFLTFRDGEISEARAVRDACIGAFAAAVVGITGLVAVIKWDAPITEQKVAIGAAAILCVGAVAALVVAWVQQRHIKHTRTQSAYSRLIATIEAKFQLAKTPDTRTAWYRWFF